MDIQERIARMDASLERLVRSIDLMLSATVEPVSEPIDQRAFHSDDAAVDQFASAMKQKMAQGRAAGRRGWNDPYICPTGFLQGELARCVAKGDPVDVANLAMMLFIRQAKTAAIDSTVPH